MIRIPRDQEDHIIAVYREGHSRAVTAKLCGVSPDTITAIFRRRGLQMRPRGGARPILTHRDYEGTLALYEAGYSEAEIGVMMGRTRGAISWRLRYAGVPRRTWREAMALKKGQRPDPQSILQRYGLAIQGWPKSVPGPGEGPGGQAPAGEVPGSSDPSGRASGGHRLPSDRHVPVPG